MPRGSAVGVALSGDTEKRKERRSPVGVKKRGAVPDGKYAHE
jgi:hypothetical protein